MISRLIWELRICHYVPEEGIVLNEPSVVAIRTQWSNGNCRWL